MITNVLQLASALALLLIMPFEYRMCSMAAVNNYTTRARHASPMVLPDVVPNFTTSPTSPVITESVNKTELEVNGISAVVTTYGGNWQTSTGNSAHFDTYTSTPATQTETTNNAVIDEDEITSAYPIQERDTHITDSVADDSTTKITATISSHSDISSGPSHSTVSTQKGIIETATMIHTVATAKTEGHSGVSDSADSSPASVGPASAPLHISTDVSVMTTEATAPYSWWRIVVTLVIFCVLAGVILGILKMTESSACKKAKEKGSEDECGIEDNCDTSQEKISRV